MRQIMQLPLRHRQATILLATLLISVERRFGLADTGKRVRPPLLENRKGAP
jgi:hypothetical protein